MVQSAIRGDYGVRSGAAAVVGRPAGRQQLEIRIFIYFVLWNNCFGILIYFVILDLQGYFSYYTEEPKAISRPDIMLFVTVCQKKLPKFIAKSKLLHIWSYLFGPLAVPVPIAPSINSFSFEPVVFAESLRIKPIE